MPDAKKNKNIAKIFRGPLSDLKKKKGPFLAWKLLISPMDWERVKFKTKKSRSLILRSGKLIDFHFMLCSEEIPTIQE